MSSEPRGSAARPGQASPSNSAADGEFRPAAAPVQTRPRSARVRRALHDLWYVSDRRIRTKPAALRAIEVADAVSCGQPLEREYTEEELFSALHTCAFRSAGRSRIRRVTGSEKARWARRWHHIREHIVQRNLGLVHLMIRRFRLQSLDEDDLLSEAMYGLSRAVDRFNPWKGYRFSTYACNAIARGLMRRGKGESRYRRLFPVQHDASYERPSEMPDHQTDLYVERLKRVITRNLGALTDLECTILTHRFPMDAQARQTFQEIGNMVGLSKERVRQIQNIALQKLRTALGEDTILQ